MPTTIENKLIATNTLWIITDKSLRLILGILVVGLVARHMGAEIYGQLNFSLAALAIAMVAASMGMNRIVPRETIEAISNRRVRAEIISTAFFIRLVTAIIITTLLFILSCLLHDQEKALFLLVVASLVFSPFEVIDLHQQGIAKVKEISIIRSLVFVLASLIKVSLVFTEAELIWFFAIVLFEHCLLAACLFALIAAQQGAYFISPKHCKRARIQSLLSESRPEVFAGLGGILFTKLDQVMLQFMQGAESVGIYSAAVRISEAWYFIPTAIISATFPKIIQLRTTSPQRYTDAIMMLLSVLVGISMLGIAFFAIFSSQIIEVVFGKDFSESALILQLHCFSAVFIFLGSASGSWLAAEKKLSLNLQRNMFGLAINIVLNLILIQRFGAIGAAAATLISCASAYYLFDLFSPQLRFMFRCKTKALLTLGFSGILSTRKKPGD